MLAEEGKQFDLSVFSPPFASLYAYTDSIADMGNSKDSDDEFLLHYEFFAKALFPLIKSGRNVCVHLQQVVRTKGNHGHMGLFDIRGYVNKIMQDAGFILYGEVAIPKNPQAQSIRLKAHQLQFTQWEKDSTVSRPALADWLQIYKAPGDNEVPVKPLENGLNRDIWIEWADMIWKGQGNYMSYPASVWFDIRETWLLNNTATVEKEIGSHHKPANTKFEGDERHMCPLQLDLIERCILLWSNPGETIFTPFAGIGSELIGALKHKRNALGCELNPAYVDEATRNLEGLISKQREESKILSLF
jgi:hypothetical protein